MKPSLLDLHNSDKVTAVTSLRPQDTQDYEKLTTQILKKVLNVREQGRD